MTAIIGIDPGKTGAFARLCLEKGSLEIMDMPVLEVVKARKRSLRINAVQLATRLQLMASRGCDLVVLEQPMAMPGQGSASVFDIGRSFGMLEGIVASMKLRCEIAHPAAWKRAMKCPAAKDGALARATQLMPQHAHLWPLKKHDGRAESALLALYGAEHLLASAAARPAREVIPPGTETCP